MNYILFHIPHASLKIPKLFWNVCIKDSNYIKNSNIFLSDYLVDKLIPTNSHKIIFKYSRLFCDVEKFKDDSKEYMSKIGMGAIYTNDCNGVITKPNNKYKKKVIKSYYDKYHNKLNKLVTNILKNNNKCIIIDLHSFSDEMVSKVLNSQNNPDICIGSDDFFTDKNLLELTITHFKEYGFSIEINKPYNGTLIPNKYLTKKEPNLTSIMLEINKRIYLENNDDFYILKNCIDSYVNKIKLL